MAKLRIYSVLMTGILLLVSLCVYPLDHYVRVSADFAYARDCATGGLVWDNTTPTGLKEAQALIGSGVMERGVSGNGLAPGAGAGYRLVHNHFLLDVGVGAEYRQTWLRPNDVTNAYAEAKDEEGLAYVGHHRWTGRHAVQRHVGLNLPVMVGGEWDEWYFLVGVKGAIDVWGTYSERGLYSLDGTYDRYMDAFNGMPNHGFVTDEPYRTEPVAPAMSMGLRVCAEAGYCVYGASDGRYKKKETVKVYVSAFGEYGVLNSKDAYTPFLLGARATVLIPLPKRRECTCSKF